MSRGKRMAAGKNQAHGLDKVPNRLKLGVAPVKGKKKNKRAGAGIADQRGRESKKTEIFMDSRGKALGEKGTAAKEKRRATEKTKTAHVTAAKSRQSVERAMNSASLPG